MGAVALVAVTGLAAAAFQIAPEVVTQVSTPPTGLWVPAPVTGEIVRVDAAALAVTARVSVAEPGAEIELRERDGVVIVVDRTAGVISSVDPTLHEITRSVEVADLVESPVDVGAETIAVGNDTEVLLIDSDTLTVERTTVPGPVRSLAVSSSAVFAENSEDMVSIDGTGAVSSSAAPAGPLVAVDDGVAMIGESAVLDGEGREIACFERDVVAPLHVVGSTEGLVTVVENEALHIADLDGGCKSYRIGGDEVIIGRPVVADGHVYVPEPDTGVVHIASPEPRIREHQIFVPGGGLRLVSLDDFVVAYDTTTPVAALLGRDGSFEVIDIAGQGLEAFADDDAELAVVDTDPEEGPAAEGSGAAGSRVDAPIVDANVLGTTLENPDDGSNELDADFEFSASTVEVGTAVRFVDTSSGSPDAWSWDFGDGTGAEGPSAEKAWDETGTYPVTLTVRSGDESDQVTLAITVVPVGSSLPIDADFIFSSTIVGVGQTVSFEDRSDGDIERWRWDFDDGTTAVEPDVTKVWDEEGTYNVTLTVSNAQGSDAASIPIEVIDGLGLPVAEITTAPERAGLGSPVTFRAESTGGQATFRWDFGDGRTATGAEVVHVFFEERTYTVEVTAENGRGTSSARTEIVISAPTTPPTAAIAALPTVIEVGQNVELASLSSNRPDTETWSFGDGASATGRQVNHTWVSPGRYDVVLIATNAAGSDTATRTVDVVAALPAPDARIGAFDDTPWVGTSVRFVDASTSATSWTWDFGDGVTSSAQNPLHTFTSPGPKVVTLTVANRNGSDSTQVLVEPRLRPFADFAVSSAAVRAGDVVTFTDTSVNVTRWFWDFGDETSSSAQNPTHTYTSPGEYPVTLTVESSTGDVAIAGPVTISVDPARPALAAVQMVPIGSPITTLADATFTAVAAPASGPIDQYEINYGDGTAPEAGTSPQFTHAFARSGVYTVQMRARGPLGDWSPWVTRSSTVVDPAPPAVAIAASVPATATVGSVPLSATILPGSGPISSWRWEITGPGGTPQTLSGQTVNAAFAQAGTYQLRVVATGPVVETAATGSITITPPPPPVFSAINPAPSSPTVGTPVTFTPVGVNLGSVVSWEWNYGSGVFVAGGQTGNFTYANPGTRTVTVRATGPWGDPVTFSTQVTINPVPDPTPPVATPSGPIVTGTSVNFTSSDAGGRTGLIWTWTASSGGTTIPLPGTGPSTSHTFTTPGSWTVRVTATDSNGASDAAQTSVTVVAPLNASFDFSPAGARQIQFTDTSGPATVDGWTWNFGPGTGSTTVANPLVTFEEPGSYTVTLTVTSGGRTSAPFSQTITVPGPGPVP